MEDEQNEESTEEKSSYGDEGDVYYDGLDEAGDDPNQLIG